ncbi:MAG: hypothetical protein V7724_04160 [Sediminicola sp.]
MFTSYNTLRFLRICPWALLPLLLISNSALLGDFKGMHGFDGNSSLMATGDYSNELNGEVSFETSIATSSDNGRFFTLQLDLSSEGSEEGQDDFGFLISHKMGSEKLGVGTFQVVPEPEGFINQFNGVFGFANIRSLGEVPFFAENGSITIFYVDKGTAIGAIAVNLRNAEGKHVKVVGNFKAHRSVNMDPNMELVGL